MIIVIAGPTASGKTDLSLELAKKYNAEIINADSTQIFREMNIGTAKIEDMKGIKHHLLDIKDLDEEYNIFDYQKDGRKILKDNKNYIIVGGSGLYIKALLYNYNFKDNDENNLLYDAIFIGLKPERQELYNYINNRVDTMIDNGLIEEVTYLNSKYKDNYNLNRTIGYKEIILHLNNELTLDEAKELLKKNTRNYAKRQLTFFRNKLDLKWFNVDYNNFNKTIKEVNQYINNKST